MATLEVEADVRGRFQAEAVAALREELRGELEVCFFFSNGGEGWK